MMSDCLICKIINGDVPSTKVYEDDLVYVYKDIYPQAPVHTLIVPRQHIASINDIGPDEQSLIGHMFLVAKDLAAEAGISESGYRLLFNTNADAGQTLFHIHLHLLGGQKMTTLG